jgi:hypothetical protein
MIQFGPYGPNHSTAATFAFKRKLLKETQYDDSACLAEEKKFLKDYTIPFVQLDPLKTILVFSHSHNSFDKKTLLDNPNPFMKQSDKTVDDFIKEPDIKDFFCQKIDSLLDNYDFGKIEHKPDVIKQTQEIQIKRDLIIKEQQMTQNQSMNLDNIMIQTPIGPMTMSNFIANYEKKLSEQSVFIQDILRENGKLREKNQHLEDKLKLIIKEKIEEKKKPI